MTQTQEKNRLHKFLCLVVICSLIFTWILSACPGYVKLLIDHSFYPREYQEYVEQYAELYGMEPNLVYAIIKAESKFLRKAVSSAGAMGLMQIMPQTYEEDICRKIGLPEDADLLDPETNIQSGVWYFTHWYA